MAKGYQDLPAAVPYLIKLAANTFSLSEYEGLYPSKTG